MTRIAAQPGEDITQRDLAAILAGADRTGGDAAAMVERLGDGVGCYRSGWEFALGEDGAGARVYVGARPMGIPLTGKMGDLRKLGFWPERIESEACDLLERMRIFLLPTGVAWAGGRRAGYKLYMTGASVVVRELHDRILMDEPPVIADAFADFLGHMKVRPGAECPHSWSVGLDAAGGLVDWKMELHFPDAGLHDLLSAWAELGSFYAWCVDVAAEIGWTLIPAGVSFRARRGEASVVLYTSFGESGPSRKPLGGLGSRALERGASS